MGRMSDIVDTFAEFEPHQKHLNSSRVPRDMLELSAKVVSFLPPEPAQRVTVRLWSFASNSWVGRALQLLPPQEDDKRLQVDVLGMTFPNPIGQAAGLDKNALIRDGVRGVGFGFGEAGTVTPKPQKGNEGTRLFRLPGDRAVINRMGFNNDGVDVIARRLRERDEKRGILGVNIGANKVTDDRIADYVTCFRELASLAEYVTINVSSPNTPGLRGLQNRSELEHLLEELQTERSRQKSKIPFLLKIAPDLDPHSLKEIAAVTLNKKIEGLIISNTTITRPNLTAPARGEVGGLSGRPLFALSTQILREMYRLVGNKTVLIGVGGIASGADAYEKIRAGASLVQLYTALIYEGPNLVKRIKRELLQCLERDGFANVSEAVGADLRGTGAV
jgi:dihydroorotate dehydrogenase